jgi:hypothetical protein
LLGAALGQDFSIDPMDIAKAIFTSVLASAIRGACSCVIWRRHSPIELPADREDWGSCFWVVSFPS